MAAVVVAVAVIGVTLETRDNLCKRADISHKGASTADKREKLSSSYLIDRSVALNSQSAASQKGLDSARQAA